MLNLDNIALWTTIGRPGKEYAARVVRMLEYCLSFARWRDVVIFTVEDLGKLNFPARVIQVPYVEFPAWNILVHRTMPHVLFEYQWVMHVHEDGFPIEPSLWEDKFMEYDYIGAPWGDGFVGSAGFMLVSHRLLYGLVNAPWFDGVRNGDEWICRDQKKFLENFGVQFAPADVAARFSTETTHHDQPSFGYHGVTHCPHKYKLGWEKIEAFEKEQHGNT